MKRLNDAELEARIHKFLRRKFDEFPEIKQESARQDGPNFFGRIKPAAGRQQRISWAA